MSQLGYLVPVHTDIGLRTSCIIIGLTSAAVPAGGPKLQAAHLSADLFEAAAMKAVDKDLLAMKVAELKEELEARGEGRTGNKAWLRRRLHAAIVREYLGS